MANSRNERKSAYNFKVLSFANGEKEIRFYKHPITSRPKVEYKSHVDAKSIVKDHEILVDLALNYGANCDDYLDLRVCLTNIYEAMLDSIDACDCDGFYALLSKYNHIFPKS